MKTPLALAVAACALLAAGPSSAQERKACPSRTSPAIMDALARGAKAKAGYLAAVAQDCERVVAFGDANDPGPACGAATRLECFRKEISGRPPRTVAGANYLASVGGREVLKDASKYTSLPKSLRAAHTFDMLASQLDMELLVAENTKPESYFTASYAPASPQDAQLAAALKSEEGSATAKLLAGLRASRAKILGDMAQAERSCGAAPCTPTELRRRSDLKAALLARERALAPKPAAAASN